MKLKHVLRFASLSLAIAACVTTSAHADIALVEDGQAKAIVVTADKPSGATRLAEAALNDHLFQMSGTRLPIVRESGLATVKHAGPLLCLGDSKAAERLGATSKGLGPGGILVKTYPKVIVLLGPDDKTPSDRFGTWHASVRFMEDALGIRWLWPGESGKVVPAWKTIRVGKLDVRYTPSVQQRYIRWMGYSDRVEVGLKRLGIPKAEYNAAYKEAGRTVSRSGSFFQWHCLGGSLGLASGHAFGHMWEKYSKDHPDWFAMQPNGSRDQSKLSPHRSRLCVSNRELIEAIAQEKVEYLKANPNRKSVSIGPNDGGRSTFCTCPECEKLDAPEGRKITLWDFTGKTRRDFEHVSLTDRYVHFWNGIAEIVATEFPDVWLTADAYSVYAAPPVKRTLHPNVAIRFVGIHYMSDEARKTGRADWDSWSKAAKKIYWRPNLLLAGRREGAPFIYVHKLAEDVRYMARNSLIGTDFDSCAHNWATQGLNYYVLARLLWDADRDVDELIDDYCRAGFGPAASDVKAYLMRIEALSNEIATKGGAITAPYTPEAIAELRSFLDSAHNKTTGDPAALRRIRFLRFGLDFTDLQAASYRLLDETNAKGLTPEICQRANEPLTKKWELARQMFLDEPYAVNTPYVYWGGEARFGRLGFTCPKPKINPPLEVPK